DRGTRLLLRARCRASAESLVDSARCRGDVASGPRDPRPGAFSFSGGEMAQVESRNRATSDPEARKNVLQQMKDEGVEDVLQWFTDLEGHLKSFSITTSEVEGALDDGMGFQGSSETGFNAIE